jgi:hypothetical protein
LNERFEKMGFDSLNFIDNSGSFLYYLMIIAMLTVMMGLFFFLGLARIGNYLKEMLIWSSIIRLLIESSVDLMISSLIRIREVRDTL